MKSLILSLMVAVAMSPLALAGEDCCKTAAAGTCSEAKTTCTEAKTACCDAKAVNTADAKAAKKAEKAKAKQAKKDAKNKKLALN